MKPVKVCFVSLYSYALFNVKSNLVFGGSEVRAAQFGKALAADPRFEVSFIVHNHDNRTMEQIGNIKVWRHSYWLPKAPLAYRLKVKAVQYVRKKAQFPYFVIRRFDFWATWIILAWLFAAVDEKVRSFLASWLRRPITIEDVPVLPRQLAIYKKVDADVYCVIGVSEISAEVMKYCEMHSKKLVLLCGSAIDLLPIYVPGSREKNLYGCRGNLCYYSLANAHRIVAQTQDQARLLTEHFGRKSIIIRNPIHLSCAIAPSLGRRFVLWVGKSDDVKRPELVLALARKLPEVRFVMVMNRSNTAKFSQVMASRPANATVIERVAIDKIEKLFARAMVLLNTSDFEGFPNAFLQAGKYAVPVLSLGVDPDGLLKSKECGLVAQGSMELLEKQIRRLVFDVAERARLGANIRSYVEKHHDSPRIVAQLIGVIQSCLDNTGQVQDTCPPAASVGIAG